MKYSLLAIPMVFAFSVMGNTSIAEENSKHIENYTPKNFTVGEVCRAGISFIMLQSYKETNIEESKGGVISLSYNRKDDNSIWEYRCKLDGNRIVWRGNKKGDKEGPWRDRDSDSVVLFEEKGEKLKFIDIYQDGSTSTSEFERKGSNILKK